MAHRNIAPVISFAVGKSLRLSRLGQIRAVSRNTVRAVLSEHSATLQPQGAAESLAQPILFRVRQILKKHSGSTPVSIPSAMVEI